MILGLGAGGTGPGPRGAMQTRGRMLGSNNQVGYPSPFFDLAHTYYPATVKQLFRWCRYYFLTNPLVNATVFKLAEYPVTDIVVDDASKPVANRWTEYLQDHLRYRSFQTEIGLDYFCLEGNTPVVTSEGVFPIRELSGKTVQVLSEGGIYRPASFRSFGEQELWEVHTHDGVILATENHRWPVLDYNSGKTIWRVTKELKNRSLVRTVAPRPVQDSVFWEGVRHGVIFGDGTLSNEGRQAHVILYTKEKQYLARYFEGHATVTWHHQEKYLGVYGLPPAYKELPKTEDARYWYGFVCGLLATDGSVDVRGQTVLTQKDSLPLLEIYKRLPLMGLVGGRVREHTAWNSFSKDLLTMTYLGLVTSFMQKQDFIRPDQLRRFEENYGEGKATKGKHPKVKKVVRTGRMAEVFCCEEPETHSFVIGNGLLTGNCYGNAMLSLSYPFKKYLTCLNCKFSAQATKIRNYWSLSNYNFRLNCPGCGLVSDALAKDYFYKDEHGIKLLRWNPEDIEIIYNDVTGDYTYFYTIPSSVKNDILIGRKDIVEAIPQVYISALKESKGITFSKDNFFHLRRPSLATIDRGWGTPLLLPVLKDAFYLQLMKKAQEAILLEHMVPLRVLFPQAGSGSSDVYTTVNLVEWREHVAAEIGRWRWDSNYIPIMPLPIGNQTIGGDGKALMLTNEIQQWSDQIIMGMGVPREFLQGGLSYAGTNVSMRMLENSFLGYILRHKALLRWVVREVASFMGWPTVMTRFKPFKMADDLQRKAYLAQLNQMGKISDTTLLADADLDQAEENATIEKETPHRFKATQAQQRAMAELQGEQQLIMSRYQAKAQQAMMASQQAPTQGEPGGPEQMGQGTPGGQEAATPAGAPPQGAAPINGNPQQTQSPLNAGQRLPEGQAGVSPVDMAYNQALALRNLPPDQIQSALMNLEAQSPEIAGLVRQMLSKMGVEVAPPDAAQMGVDMRPMPEARAPRRLNGMV